MHRYSHPLYCCIFSFSCKLIILTDHFNRQICVHGSSYGRTALRYRRNVGLPSSAKPSLSNFSCPFTVPSFYFIQFPSRIFRLLRCLCVIYIAFIITYIAFHIKVISEIFSKYVLLIP